MCFPTVGFKKIEIVHDFAEYVWKWKRFRSKFGYKSELKVMFLSIVNKDKWKQMGSIIFCVQ